MRRTALAAAAAICLMFVTANSAQLPAPLHRTRVIAHRGFSGIAPENTMSAFMKAAEAGADMIELDVHLTSDGKLAVIHDGNTKRTTGVEGEISKMTYEQVSKLDAGSAFNASFAGEKIPELQQVLEWAKGKVQVNIEIKSAGCEKRVVELVNELGLKDSVIVSSFVFEYIKKVKELDPEILTAALVGDITSKKEIDGIVKQCKPDALHPRFVLVNKSIIEAAHDRGLTVNAYTVNDAVTMQKLAKFGIDGIITNFPETLIGLLDKPAKSKTDEAAK